MNVFRGSWKRTWDARGQEREEKEVREGGQESGYKAGWANQTNKLGGVGRFTGGKWAVVVVGQGAEMQLLLHQMVPDALVDESALQYR